MHEMHLLKSLLSDLLKAAAENQAMKITKVYLKMGKFTEINEEILCHYFKENSKGTAAANAELIIEPSETRELRLVSFDCL